MARYTRLLMPLLVGGVMVTGFVHGRNLAKSSHSAAPPSSDRDWVRFGWDVERSSSSTAPTGITAANVAGLHRQQVTIPGTADSSAIYLHGVTVKGATHDVFFLTTTYGKTLAIDANDGTILWVYTPPGYDSWAGSRQITTATPLAETDREYIYAASPDGHIQKLAVADGHAVWSTAITLLPVREKIASPMNEFKGRLIAVTGGYIGDRPPYQGHVAILDPNTGKLEQVWNALCSDREGLIDPSSCPQSDAAIWGRAGAVIDPSTGNIFVATGNALWDGKTYWGDALLELDPTAKHLIGNYTPTNTAELNDTDEDLGSTSPVLLGGDLIAQGGKDRKIRLLSKKAIAGTAPHMGGELQIMSTPSGDLLFTAPAVWHNGSETWMFAGDRGGTAAWQVQDDKLVEKWKNTNGGNSPILAGGLLYVYDPKGGLRVYQPASGQLIATLDCGPGHWNSPIAIDGHIALPEGNANAHQTTGVFDIWSVGK